jgi:eukaryotic-like serine/threonine-protein kinase
MRHAVVRAICQLTCSCKSSKIGDDRSTLKKTGIQMVENADQLGRMFGKYRIVHQVGRGDLADVYLAVDSAADTQVAIKLLHTELNDEEVEKFLSQTRTISNLSHPHIVRMLDFGLENNNPFLVMDYAPYGSLRQHHLRGTRLPLSTIVSYVKQIAAALQHVHDQHLIHRDIKPHNMLLGPDHEILLSDFGIAVVSQSMGYRRQKVQEFEGTILYAAPEQLRGRPRTASDQYALSTVVYEWLTGDWPFHGSVEEIASQHTLVPPPPLHEKMPMPAPSVEFVVLKALAKEPQERFASVQEFAKALERASRLDQADPGRLRHPTPIPVSPLPVSAREAALAPDNATQSDSSLLTYCGHTEKIHLLMWSPDGRHIASSAHDETIQLWDAATGEHVLTRRVNSLQAPALTWSPDGKWISTTNGLSSESIQIWDAFTNKLAPGHASYANHDESVLALAWSPDGKYIASCGENKTVRVWDVVSGRTIHTHRGHSQNVTSLAWSADSRRIASCSEDMTVQVWDAASGSSIFVYYAHSNKVNAVTWSPAGTHIASASEDMTVQVWDASSGRKVLTYSGHSGGVTAVSWSPDGLRIASSSLDETVQVWHVLTGSTLFTYTGHVDWVSTMAWSPRGSHIASGSWDKTVQVWEPR